MIQDHIKVANNTGYAVDEVKQVKDYLFVDEHDLIDDTRRFDASYESSQSWQRLVDGKNIQTHDLTLLNHEIMESKLVSDGLSQDEAHTITSKVYNYRKEVDEYYGKNG